MVEGEREREETETSDEEVRLGIGSISNIEMDLQEIEKRGA